MASAITNQGLRENKGGADNLDSSSDFLYTEGYCVIQKDLKELYSSLHDFVVKQEFKTHILEDAFGMDDIEKKLNQQKADVMKTECPIVIAGETSSGKSSIINLILHEEILPTGITSCTSRVCRVKHGDQFVISTKDSNEEELEDLSFENLNEMAEQMDILAKTEDEKIRYVDVYMDAPLLQGNVMIVDTPGCGDMGQKEVSDMMMSYLPNALAFVFVLNVSNAGGIQDDRVSKGKEKYTKVFDEFEKTLKDVITRNENKRVKVHLRLLNEILDEFNRVLSTKLLCAEQNAEDNESKLNRLSTELEKLENSREEELFNIKGRIDIFLNEATTRLHEYVHSPHFRAEILKDTDTFTRFSIRRALDVRIEENLKAWQEQNIDNIFHEVIMEYLFEKFESIHRSLHSIKDNLKGFQTPFNVDTKIIPVIAWAIKSEVGLNLNFLVMGLRLISGISEINRSKVLQGIAAAGIVGGIIFSGLMIARADDFETTREKAFQVRVDALTKTKVKYFLREYYFEPIQKMKRAFLEGDLEKEMNKIKENISSMRNKHKTYISQKEILSSMHQTVIHKIERLKQIGCIAIVNE